MKPVTESVAQLEAMYSKECSFTVEDSGNVPLEILSHVVECLGAVHNGVVWEYKGSAWMQIVPPVELSIDHTDIMVEGDLIVAGKTLALKFNQAAIRIGEELSEITGTTQAYYDLQIDAFYEDGHKAFTALDELSISKDGSGYAVHIEHKQHHFVGSKPVDRYKTLDYGAPSETDAQEPAESPRFKDLDMDPKGAKVKKAREKPMPRFQNLDLNARLKPEFEALLFQMDQQQVKTAAQKLGKQVFIQPVAKSIQSKVDKMSYQKAYDVVEDARKAWEDADAYHQYADTVELASKWYQNNCAQVSGFDVIDKSYYAADLMRKISSLEDKIAQSKSRSAIAKMEQELGKAQDDLARIMPEIRGALKGATGQEEVDARTRELEQRKDAYEDAYMDNLSEWKAIQGKMEKAGKLIETMEAIKAKYASQYDLPPLLSRYKDLMDTPLPSLIDVGSLEDADAGILYTAWRQSMMAFRKKLESFNDSFRQNYGTLAGILALKAKSRSLF